MEARMMNLEFGNGWVGDGKLGALECDQLKLEE